MFGKITSHPDTITYSEFILASIPIEQVIREEEIKYAFKWWDTDGDGRVTAGDLLEMEMRLGREVRDTEGVELVIRESGGGGDGIRWTEWDKLMRKAVAV